MAAMEGRRRTTKGSGTEERDPRDAEKGKTEAATRWRIPLGYSLKHWDATEAPITLLGSVFDGNSLGKYIFDWTVYTLGAATPMTDVAGDLWLLLIKLAGKAKRAEESVGRIRSVDEQQTVKDFVAGRWRLWRDIGELLKRCEKYMWKGEPTRGATMDKKAGVELVKSMFGRDRELERTEELMGRMRLWIMRFEANCEETLRCTRRRPERQAQGGRPR
jgi:hypothetical protein